MRRSSDLASTESVYGSIVSLSSVTRHVPGDRTVARTCQNIELERPVFLAAADAVQEKYRRLAVALARIGWDRFAHFSKAFATEITAEDTEKTNKNEFDVPIPGMGGEAARGT